MSAQVWDEVFDVVVVGSGAGALTSALLAADGGASVCVVEKSEYIGGTTAASGGDMWIPCNRHIADQDTREEAIDYVTRLSDGRAYDPHLIEVYVDTAAEALDYLETHTGLVTRAHKGLPDYYAVVPGRIPGTKDVPRSVSCQPYPAVAELGAEWAARVNPSPWVKPPEVAYAEAIEVVPREELLRRRAEGYRAKGGGLVAPLLKALLDRGVSVRWSTPGRDLVTNEAGGVIGVVAGEDGALQRLGARKGVVLATGGFEWNEDMVKTFLGYDVKPCTPWTNTGDGHRMAMRAGAKLGLMTSFFSYGVMHDPWEIGRDGNPLPQMEMGLGAGTIIVNQQGKRFMHGGYTYNDFSHPFNFFDQRNPGFTNKAPGWCVFGAAKWEGKGVFGGHVVDGVIVGPNGQPAPSWLLVANSIRELAEKMGVDPDTLEETVARYNEFAEKGEDPDWGDPQQVRSATGPDTTSLKPVLGPIYGAILQWPGTLGTSGGPKIDADARVLGTETPIIDGLYAAGNTAASVLGGTYPGGGSCVGPSMVMGYRAGRHAAAQPTRDIN
ncbi:FAD-dependent oxidoreductase [Pseudofrankia inefficax]|uniref:Fumarate reductase/succinate dehydrogenase flavoprotein domain protein n=1 Tax=Pseudofrankia inefficax (strain DSM 45817 / CECT 9037 / DDB 130130 / EuI1c) TaxID=298654 RepID=E3JBB0_PSEI1|nr:FAD-dependent oxidoreductase [Pseudofrankia inefficax]ADP78640.1 fumarate reductase/succinate dehydrogenase flavoprotein domain protein [Pseudofrankia inefficax]